MSPPPASPGCRTPPLRPPKEPPLPPALLPPKKRWTWLWRNPPEATASDSDPAPPPTVVSQIHATPAAASPAAGQERSSPLQPLAGDHKLNTDAPPAPAGADGKPSMPQPSKRQPKVVRRVRKFAVRTKVVPKGTTSGSGAAAPNETTDAEEAAPAPVVAGPLPLQAVAVEEEEEQEPGEFVPNKPGAAIFNNAVAASQLLLDEEGDDEARIFGRQEMKMREVFVGALHRDAKEEDVRAALAPEAGGGITYVRVIMHNKMKKKNRGYCFVRFREPAGATRAIAAAELGNVKICGKPCRIEALDSSKLRIGQGDPFEDYTRIPYREKRPLSTLSGNSSYCMSRNPRARNGSNAYATETSSFGAVSHVIGGYSPLYHHGSIMYLPDSNFYGLAEPWGEILMRQSGSRRPGQPHGSKH